MINQNRPLFTIAMVGAILLACLMGYGVSYTQYSPDFRPTVTPIPTPTITPTRGPTSTPIPPTTTPVPLPTPTMGPTPALPISIDEVKSWCFSQNQNDCSGLTLNGASVIFYQKDCYGIFRIPTPNIALVSYQNNEARGKGNILIAPWQQPEGNVDTNIIRNVCWAEFKRP